MGLARLPRGPENGKQPSNTNASSSYPIIDSNSAAATKSNTADPSTTEVSGDCVASSSTSGLTASQVNALSSFLGRSDSIDDMKYLVPSGTVKLGGPPSLAWPNKKYVAALNGWETQLTSLNYKLKRRINNENDSTRRESWQKILADDEKMVEIAKVKLGAENIKKFLHEALKQSYDMCKDVASKTTLQNQDDTLPMASMILEGGKWENQIDRGVQFSNAYSAIKQMLKVLRQYR